MNSTLNPFLVTVVVGGDDGRRLGERRRRGGPLLVRLVLDRRVRRRGRPQTLGLPDLVQDLRRESAVHARHALVQVVLGARGQQLLDPGFLHDVIVSPVQALLALQPVAGVHHQVSFNEPSFIQFWPPPSITLLEQWNFGRLNKYI